MVSRVGAPGVLLLLTRVGIPVSTSFLVLSAFASTFILEKMLMKSMMGYAVAAVAAYAIWMIVVRILDEAKPVNEKHKNCLASWAMANNRLFMVDLAIS